MIIYNVTIKIDPGIRDEWVQWMQDEHIPEVMATGLFQEYKMCRLLEQDESEGITYAIQYTCKNVETYETYQEKYAPELKTKHLEKFGNRFVAFRTLLEVL